MSQGRPPPYPPPIPQRADVAAPATGTEFGVYFRDEDYAGVFRRLMVDVIDVTLVAIVCAIIVTFIYTAFDRVDEPRQRLLLPSYLLCTAVCFLYFVLLKRSRLRTLGYRMGGVRIVNLRGQRPGIIALSVRLLFAFFGPFNFLIDLMWIGNDDNRQALRDKFVRTYVVRRNAQPAGTGPIKYEYYAILGTNFIFAEVTRPAVAPPPAPPRSPAQTAV